jgi:exoribonuclease II
MTLRILAKYTIYYSEVRTHISLAKDAPCTRPIERFGDIVAHPILGGLVERDNSDATPDNQLAVRIGSGWGGASGQLGCSCDPRGASNY